MTRRALVPAALASVALAGGAWLVGSEAPSAQQPLSACELVVGTGYVCRFATPGYPAVVVVRAFEDGSASVAVVDNGR